LAAVPHGPKIAFVQTEGQNPSLFDRLGGEAAIEAAVVGFYDRVMSDPTLAPFFDGLDMGAQIKKQIAFMTMAFAGPNKYSGRDLRTAHARLVQRGLADSHFDSIQVHLRETLEELGVDPSTVGEVAGIVETTRRDVLGK
jgi:hemoglobin